MILHLGDMKMIHPKVTMDGRRKTTSWAILGSILVGMDSNLSKGCHIIIACYLNSYEPI
jgi:hypothetical protein